MSSYERTVRTDGELLRRGGVLVDRDWKGRASRLQRPREDLSASNGAGGYSATAAVSRTASTRFFVHSSKVAGRPASSRSASAGGQPFSRKQRARMSLVEATNEIERQAGWPLLRYWRWTIHCNLSAANAHLPEIANCRSGTYHGSVGHQLVVAAQIASTPLRH